MKYYIFISIITLLLASNTKAQQIKTDTTQTLKSYAFYRQKRNTYNTIGWVCLGTGSLLAVSGFVVNVGETFNHGNSSKGEAVAIAGELVALASIPFFISAHHNKKKAMLYLNKGSAMINDRPFYKTKYTGVSLAINF